MDKDAYWDTFLGSGSVADYLKFKEIQRDETTNPSESVQAVVGQKEAARTRAEVKNNAGFY